MNIMMNAREITVEQAEISYEEIVDLVHKGSKTLHTVTYSKGRNGINGSLTPSESVVVNEGMSISAMVTGNA